MTHNLCVCVYVCICKCVTVFKLIKNKVDSIIQHVHSLHVINNCFSSNILTVIQALDCKVNWHICKLRLVMISCIGCMVWCALVMYVHNNLFHRGLIQSKWLLEIVKINNSINVQKVFF